MQNDMSRNVYGNMPAAVSGQALVPDQNIYTNMHAALSGLTLAPSLTSTQHDNPKVETDIGSEAFGGASLRHAAYLKQGKSGNTSMPMNEPNMNAMIGHQANGAMIFQLPDGTFMYAGSNGAQGNYHQYPSQYNLPLTQTSQYQQAAYNGMHSVGVLNNPHTPRNHPWIHHQGMSQVPDLVAPRRTSWSSTEELSPQTPVDGYQPTVFLSGYSPSTWNTTPSPTSVQHPYNHQIARKPNGDFVIADFQLWTQEHPAIPAPVPAWASGPDGGRGSLDKILHNPDETTNVYVRGLRPDTTDEMLAGYGSRFGAIVSQKAIVDMANNNSCKGFGFIKYSNYYEAENCIRAFYYLGYEAKFARKSHNARLKDLSEPDNNNLYISNLPRTMPDGDFPKMFTSVFPQYQILQHKILKDSNGISRGVGFARFETPEICEQIIQRFNNMEIGDGQNTTALQLRYADTRKQKELKMRTAEKREFKTNEYNEAVYGPGSPYAFLSPVSATFQSPIQVRAPGPNGAWMNRSPASSISPTYLGYPNSMLNGRQASNSYLSSAAVKADVEVAHAPARRTTHVKIESPSVVTAAKKAAVETVDVESPEGSATSASDEETLVCQSKSSKTCSTDVVLSPTKSKL